MSERVVCVTGASRGIGREIALTLAGQGMKVLVASNEADNNAKVAAEIKAAGGEAVTQFLDLTQPGQIKEAFKEMLAATGKIDILVNNAGVTKDGLAARMKKDAWDFVLQINLTGTFLCSQAVLPSMMKERWGRIVNIASVVGQMGNAGQANYVASKAGVIGLTKTLAREVAARNITVNAVAPGFIETDMTKVLSEDVIKAMLATVPLKRMGQPSDVAKTVNFLVSDDAEYITGQVVAVNGGMYM
jgi:3-oxoacyl-[acyl-carrier protein] reductase